LEKPTVSEEDLSGEPLMARRESRRILSKNEKVVHRRTGKQKRKKGQKTDLQSGNNRGPSEGTTSIKMGQASRANVKPFLTGKAQKWRREAGEKIIPASQKGPHSRKSLG